MNATSTNTADAGALGIVISTGRPTQCETRFSAYVWGPAPEADPEPSTKVA